MATLCIEGVPPESQIGLDLHSWKSGPYFRGLRAITPGLHCLHLTIAGYITTKYAVWLGLKHDQTVAYKWDKVAENLVEIDTTYAVSGKGISPAFLMECPSEEDRDWISITSHLTSLMNMVPLGKVVTSTTSSNTDTSNSDLQKIGSSITDPDELEFQFIPIDLKRSWPAGSTDQQITRHALDKTWLLKDVINRAGSEDKLLSQFEFCFLGILLYSSVSCFEQWNTILIMCCTTKLALLELAPYFTTFLALLQAQMQQVSRDLYDDIFTLTLPRQLNALQRNMRDLDEEVPLQVKENLEILLDFLNREFGADEDHVQQQLLFPLDDRDEVDEEDDEKPVVVEL